MSHDQIPLQSLHILLNDGRYLSAFFRQLARAGFDQIKRFFSFVGPIMVRRVSSLVMRLAAAPARSRSTRMRLQSRHGRGHVAGTVLVLNQGKGKRSPSTGI